MGRALVGLVKGILIGGGIGFALLKLHNPQGILAFLFCALLGALVGVVCGQAPWKAATLWTPILKMVFGAAVGAGLYAVGHRFMPSMSISIDGVAIGAYEDAGFRVVGADDILTDLLAPAGSVSALKPTDEHWSDIRLAARVASAIGALDVGQGAVSCAGIILAVEAQEGTDRMLTRDRKSVV